MEDTFGHRKIFAAVVFCLSLLWVVYSIFFSSGITALSEGTFVTTQEPVFHKPTTKGTFYSIAFQFIKPFGKQYSMEGRVLKYTDYKSVLNDIKAFDTLRIKISNDEIYQLTAKGKNYVNLAAVLKEEMQNYRFFIFFRIMICIAILPSLFFKKRPTFWHSGFEFEFRFSYLFLAIMAIGIGTYIYINGDSFLTGFQPD
ncbi:hypothetical protein [Pinibacter aurantiacus]|uniref:Uncharacterized protein n=1 Tax=Pinibacter aurantiacus TaxID=2851599 RepID=A0A9E2W3K5_9BACT|nr:hypothetical protein [Pinibacter aurantiacus]MBV4356884.1 hypothetical protein [Pinibacter aurantiacus]